MTISRSKKAPKYDGPVNKIVRTRSVCWTDTLWCGRCGAEMWPDDGVAGWEGKTYHKCSTNGCCSDAWMDHSYPYTWYEPIQRWQAEPESKERIALRLDKDPT